MEREMCSYLEWQLNVDPTTLRDFQARVQLDFAGPGPYPPMVLPQPAPAAFSHQNTGNNINSSTGSSIPAFASRVPLSKDAPVIPSPRNSNIPLITPRYPRGLPLGLDFSRVIGIAADAARCSRARIRCQSYVGRFEPGRASCHPPQPRINLYHRKACSGCRVSRPHFVGCSSQKAKDCPRSICVCDPGCLVIALSLVLYFFFPSQSLFHHLNGYLRGALSVFCLFAAPRTVLLTTWPSRYAAYMYQSLTLGKTSRSPSNLLGSSTCFPCLSLLYFQMRRCLRTARSHPRGTLPPAIVGYDDVIQLLFWYPEGIVLALCLLLRYV
jgi:hypothetical protein